MSAPDGKFTTRGIHEFLSRKYPPMEFLLRPDTDAAGHRDDRWLSRPG